MLLSIQSPVLRAGTIKFKQGLNVIIGDNNGANSIGKSSILMIVDFVYGGDTYIDHNKDTVQELGPHEFIFTLLIKNTQHVFSRDTANYKSVRYYQVDGKPPVVLKSTDYTKLLKKLYNVEHWSENFRAMVGLYTRVWGKDNKDVFRPLHLFPTQKSSECVDHIIEIFEVDADIKEIKSKLSAFESEQLNISGTYKADIVKRITKKSYNKNQDEMNNIASEINDIKTELARYAISIKEIVNKEVFSLNSQKDVLGERRLRLEYKIDYHTRGIKQSKHINTKAFNKLKEYFPDINEKRLINIDEFHSSISKILKKEIEESIRIINSELEIVKKDISDIENKLKQYLSKVDNPTVIIDRTHKLLTRHSEIKRENEIHSRDKAVSESITTSRSAYDDKKSVVLDKISLIINEKLKEYSLFIYGDVVKYPTLSFSMNDYEFSVFEDTGTGRAYSSMILLDLVVFNETKLPFIVHDTYLYKNIQNSAIDKIIELYPNDRQSIISIDEVLKYSESAQAILTENAIASLGVGRTLFIRDWQRKEDR